MRISCQLYNALSLLCALLLCMVSYASDFHRDSVEPTVKEWNAVEEFSKRMGITHEEARVAMIMATTDLVEHNCQFDPGDLYREFHEKILKDPKMQKALKEYYSYIDSICVYSRENWCAEYRGGNRIFGIW